MRLINTGPRLLSIALLLACTTNAFSLLHPLGEKPTAFPDPSIDPFYKAPSNLSSYKRGQVIRSREVPTILDYTTKSAKASYQLLYRTTDTQNQSQATVATVWEPVNPQTSPPQILSYHSYADWLTLDCSPSWAWVKGSKSNGKLSLVSDATAYIEWALRHGIYPVNADVEGPDAAFIAGFQAGQASLDSMKATRNFFRMPKNAEAGMVGYSGGASVTAWAANLAQRYAPDLNLIGAVNGGTPIDDRHLFVTANGGSGSMRAGHGLVGLMNAYPELDKFVMDHISQDDAKRIAEIRAPTRCLYNGIIRDAHFDFIKMINVTNALDSPILASVLARETLLMNVSTVGIGVAKFPRVMWSGHADEIAPLSDVLAYVDQQCQHGANIQFRLAHAAKHLTAAAEGLPEAFTFLGQIFNHTTPQVKCGTSASPVAGEPLLKAAAEVVGNKAMQALNGKVDNLLHKNTTTSHSRKRANQLHQRTPQVNSGNSSTSLIAGESTWKAAVEVIGNKAMQALDHVVDGLLHKNQSTARKRARRTHSSSFIGAV